MIDREKIREILYRYSQQITTDDYGEALVTTAEEDIIDDVLSLIEAETTEEWGVRYPSGGVGRVRVHANEAHRYADQICGVAISRRVLYGPWLPSEGEDK